MRKESHLNDMMQSLQYFEKKKAEDPSFYCDFKHDKHNIVQDIFWCDGTSRRMYELYGDCVSFDTTFKKNRYNMPFAPFVGVTGHGDNCLFGCAILQNETAETFKWLFGGFFGLHGRKGSKNYYHRSMRGHAPSNPSCLSGYSSQELSFPCFEQSRREAC
jgi:hypothetical protein